MRSSLVAVVGEVTVKKVETLKTVTLEAVVAQEEAKGVEVGYLHTLERMQEL